MSSLRSKIAVQKLSEIIRNSKGKKNMSMGKILREAGYSKQTSLKPKLVTDSKGFKEEMNKLFPDEELIRHLSDLLEASNLKKEIFPNEYTDKEIEDLFNGAPGYKLLLTQRATKHTICYYSEPNGKVITSALDMVCKIKGYYSQPKTGTSHNSLVIKEVKHN